MRANRAITYRLKSFPVKIWLAISEIYELKPASNQNSETAKIAYADSLYVTK